MKIVENLLKRKEPITFEQFAEDHDLVLEINERDVPTGHPCRYYASFKHIEWKHGAIYTSEFGNGMLKDEAVENYKKLILDKLLVYKANSAEQKQIQTPKEWKDNGITTTLKD
jgi:hypothetical protein